MGEGADRPADIGNGEEIMSQLRKYSLVVPFLIAVLYIAPLGVRPMFVPDESRYAEASREMLASGNWVSPRLNGLRYFEKPVFGYWATAVSIMMFGENNFAIRLPSALSVALTAFFISSIPCSGAKKEEETAAPLAALVFLTSLEVYAVGTFSVLDSLLSCFITGTMVAFYLASQSISSSWREKKYLALSGMFCGLAFLTKGFLAFAVPILAIVPYLLSQRRYRDILRMAWLPLLTGMLVSLPWSIQIHLHEPDFWRFFFWNEHIRRFLATNAQHRESFWYFFISAPAMFLPWVFLIPAAVNGLFSRTDQEKRKISPVVSFCICWFVFPFLFFSLSRGKLLTYILPCLPPFAILMSLGLRKVLKKGNIHSFQVGAIGAAMMYGALLVAIVALMICTNFFGCNIPLPENRDWKWLMTINGLLVMILFFIAAVHCRKTDHKILLFGLAPVLLLFVANFIIPDLTLEKKAPDLLLKRHQYDISESSVILSSEETVLNVCWQFRRDDVYIVGSPGELKFGVQFDDSRSKLVDLQQARELIEKNPGKSFLIATVRDFANWKNQLPSPAFLDNNGAKGYVFVKY